MLFRFFYFPFPCAFLLICYYNSTDDNELLSMCHRLWYWTCHVQNFVSEDVPMEKYFDINRGGYSIRSKMIINSNDKSTRNFDDVVLVTHGFGSSKETAGTLHFGEHLTSKYKGFAVIAFDWPCHGMDARKKLSVEECLTYLSLVVEYTKEELKAKRVYNYSSSLGGYLTLRYLIEKGNPFTKIALRCPAIKMYDSMMSYLSDDDKAKLAKGKEISIGFDRKMKADSSFFESLKSFNIMDHEYFDFADDMLIIHGTKDEMIPIEDSRTFAENNVIQFIPVEGANHPFQNPNHMALATHKIIEFFHGDLVE